MSLPDTVDGRYRRLVLLGEGGMGTVWLVRDDHLERDLAMKLIRSELAGGDALVRFGQEARVAASLQHPGIVPVHDLGVLPDGRPWFTMDRVHGVGLHVRAREAHAAWRTGRSGAADGGFRRLLEAFLRVCETIAYAHARGVVHRDVKPANVMLGDFGAVYVLDWGLARLGAGAAGATLGGPGLTRVGAVTGTPAYLSPEQARGDGSEVTARADVYGLGATLYELLCERPPRLARTADLLIAAIAAGSPIRPPSERAPGGAPADPALDRICTRALATDPAERYPDASALAAELGAWLDGAAARERAAALVLEADEATARADAASAEAERGWAAAAERLAALPPFAPVEAKRAAWDDEARAAAADAVARAERTRALHALRSALSHAPDWPEAHDRLAAGFHARHVALEAARRTVDAEAAAADLRAHDRTGRYAAYLEGTGAVTLHTDLPAEARLHRIVERDRRWVPEPVRSLGRTPLDAVPLAMGGWVITLHRDGHEVVTYPVEIRRGEHWHGVRPGGSEPHPIWLPPVGAVGPDARYVPAGWFWSGEDEFEHTLPVRRMWADAFAIARFPVTVGAYLGYLDALLEAGDEAAALAAAPRLGDADELLFARDSAGRFTGIRTDRDGPGWDLVPRTLDAPVTNVDWHQAAAYARWAGARLPMELEWQKPARGADRRRYPWGDHFEPTWCRMVLSAPQSMIVPVTAYPTDDSPYGVRGLAGNVSDWVADGIPELAAQRDTDVVLVRTWDAPQRIVAGGSCGAGPRTCETTQRSRITATSRGLRIGFRLAWSIG